VKVTTVHTTDVDRPLTLELWDFSGAPAHVAETTQRLTSAFFHAAVLCYSTEDPAGLTAVEREARIFLLSMHNMPCSSWLTNLWRQWKPLLQRTQIECPPFFVMGLKKDLLVDGSMTPRVCPSPFAPDFRLLKGTDLDLGYEYGCQTRGRSLRGMLGYYRGRS